MTPCKRVHSRELVQGLSDMVLQNPPTFDTRIEMLSCIEDNQIGIETLRKKVETARIPSITSNHIIGNVRQEKMLELMDSNKEVEDLRSILEEMQAEQVVLDSQRKKTEAERNFALEDVTTLTSAM